VIFWYIPLLKKDKNLRLILLILTLQLSAFSASIALPENFQAHFTQKITNTKKKVINYSGKVYFSNKTQLKWEYIKPTKKEVCTDGYELTVVDHDLEQVSKYHINKGFDLSKILQNAKEVKDRKTVYLAKYEGKSYTIQTDQKGHLSRVVYFDDLENTVLIIFSKMKYGKGTLKNSKMKCNYPNSYDIIEG
jgi:outer membrane lipoprotein carrier protein